MCDNVFPFSFSLVSLVLLPVFLNNLKNKNNQTYLIYIDKYKINMNTIQTNLFKVNKTIMIKFERNHFHANKNYNHESPLFESQTDFIVIFRKNSHVMLYHQGTIKFCSLFP